MGDPLLNFMVIYEELMETAGSGKLMFAQNSLLSWRQRWKAGLEQRQQETLCDNTNEDAQTPDESNTQDLSNKMRNRLARWRKRKKTAAV